LFNLSKQQIASKNINQSNTNLWALQAILIGCLSLFLAGIPVWMTDLRIELFFPYDRFTLPMMPGTALLIVGLVTLLIRNKLSNLIIISVLIGLAAGMHYQSALNFRKEWLTVRDFFWQMSWRMPGIEPGTLILAPELPFEYNWDNSLTAPLNWIYAPQNDTRELTYLLYNLETRLSKGLPNLKEDAPITEQHRITPFNGTTSQSILITFDPPACLRVIDPVFDQHIPNKPRYFQESLPFAKPNLIIPDPPQPAIPPQHLLGTEPDHDWCYYFEKAELARQVGDWDQVVEIGDKAVKPSKKFFQTNVAELMPFIEGYARVGRWEDAIDLTNKAYLSWENMDMMLCDLWNHVYQSSALDSQGQLAYQETSQFLQCETP
jgi:hypothetical protein